MNLPNRITILRICLIPVFMFFYLASFVPYGKVIAIAIFIIATLTDALDGHIARKRNLITNFGKLMDPLADKLLVMSGLLLVIIDGTLPSPWGIIIAMIILGRELYITAFRSIAASKNIVLAADKLGKIKAIIQDISLPLLFLLSFFMFDMQWGGNLMLAFKIVNYCLIGIATLFTVISGINYTIKNKQVFKD